MGVKVICERDELVAIADAVRNKTLSNNGMSLGEIKDFIKNTSHLGYSIITFPSTHVGETLYYTDKNGDFQSLERMTNDTLTLVVLQNTIVSSNQTIFHDTYTFSGDSIVKLNNYAVMVRSSYNFGYSDNAPD